MKRITFIGIGPALPHPERIKNLRDYLAAVLKAIRKTK